MIILITVKHNVVISLVDSLLANKFKFEFNTIRCNFRIQEVSQWMYLEDKDGYLISNLNVIESQVIIHKDNIEMLCIANG